MKVKEEGAGEGVPAETTMGHAAAEGCFPLEGLEAMWGGPRLLGHEAPGPSPTTGGCSGKSTSGGSGSGSKEGVTGDPLGSPRIPTELLGAVKEEKKEKEEDGEEEDADYGVEELDGRRRRNHGPAQKAKRRQRANEVRKKLKQERWAAANKAGLALVILLGLVAPAITTQPKGAEQEWHEGWPLAAAEYTPAPAADALSHLQGHRLEGQQTTTTRHNTYQ